MPSVRLRYSDAAQSLRARKSGCTGEMPLIDNLELSQAHSSPAVRISLSFRYASLIRPDCSRG
jgi:hypothetical protein